jgi:hypothetical protein
MPAFVFQRDICAHGLFKELADEPNVAERVCDSALKHSPDGARAHCFVDVFQYGTVLDGTGGQGLFVKGDGIVGKELDSHCGKAD